MALLERLEILLTANGTAAVNEFRKVGVSAEAELGKRTTSSLDRVAGGMQRGGAIAVGFGALLVGAMAHAANASEGATVKHLKLENTLQNMPKLAGETTKAFSDQAVALGNVTRFSAEDNEAAQALLGTFNLTGQQIRDILPLVQDYADKFDLDLTQASIQVGKALDGQIGALKRNGVSIDETRFKTDRFGAVQEALRSQVGGFAEQEGKTFNGQLAIMKNHLGEIEEGVGVGAVQAFTKLLGPVSAVSGWFHDLDPATQATVGSVAAYAGMALIAAGGTSVLIGSLIKMRNNFSSAWSVLKGFGSSLRTTDGQLRAVGFTISAVAAAALVYELIQLKKSASDAASAFTAGLGGDTASKISAVQAELARVRDTQKDYASQDLGPLHLYWSQAGAQLSRYGDALKDELKELEKQKALSDASAASTGLLGLAQQGAADETMNHLDAAKQLNDELHAAVDPLFAAQRALESNRDANNAVTEAELKLITAKKEHGAASLEAMAATQELTDAENKAIQSAFGAETALVSLKGALDNGSVSAAGAQAILDQMVQQGLIPTQGAAHEAANRLQEVIDKANGVPRDIATRITVDASQAQRTLDILTGRINQLNNSNPLYGYGIGLPGRAAGGPVKAKMTYLVGEQGREIFTAPADGEIIPAGRTRQLLASGSASPASVANSAGDGGRTVIEHHIHVEIDRREIGRAVYREEVSSR